MIIIFAFIPTSKDCSEAYSQFLKHYNKTYNQKKETKFCENYQRYLEIRSTCPYCIISPIYDRNSSLMIMYGEIPQHDTNVYAMGTCQSLICDAKDPLPPLEKIPESVDLRMSGLVTRAKDQGECGSCWAFATIAVLENTILLDQYKIKQKQFAKNARTLSLSEQFLMSNTYGGSTYCSGGNPVYALTYEMDNNWQTLEIETNYPYDYKQHQSDWDNNIFIPPKIDKSQYLIPYKTFPRILYSNVVGTLQTPVVSLKNADRSMDINKVKQYLARGISVIAPMNVDITNDSYQILLSYSGSVPLSGFHCVSTINHFVVIVGYGKFKGVPVWIVKNSWGSNWGNQGHMYVEMGTNQFCIENYAYAIIPKNYNETQGVFTGQYETPYDLVRGMNGLDINDESTYDEKRKISLNNIILIVSMGIILIGVVIGAILVILKRIQYK